MASRGKIRQTGRFGEQARRQGPAFSVPIATCAALHGRCLPAFPLPSRSLCDLELSQHILRALDVCVAGRLRAQRHQRAELRQQLLGHGGRHGEGEGGEERGRSRGRESGDGVRRVGGSEAAEADRQQAKRLAASQSAAWRKVSQPHGTRCSHATQHTPPPEIIHVRPLRRSVRTVTASGAEKNGTNRQRFALLFRWFLDLGHK